MKRLSINVSRSVFIKFTTCFFPSENTCIQSVINCEILTQQQVRILDFLDQNHKNSVLGVLLFLSFLSISLNGLFKSKNIKLNWLTSIVSLTSTTGLSRANRAKFSFSGYFSINSVRDISLKSLKSKPGVTIHPVKLNLPFDSAEKIWPALTVNCNVLVRLSKISLSSPL